MFFDDILVYNKTYSEHLEHLRVVLNTLGQHKLYAKMSKCWFGVAGVDYFGHLISGAVVKVDFAKINSMLE